MMRSLRENHTEYYNKKISRAKTAVLVISILLSVFAVYFNSIDNPFLFDDDILVKNNPLIRSIRNLPVFFKTDIFSHSSGESPVSNSYRPLQTLTYSIDYSLWGTAPSGYHLTNVLLHLCNVFLVFLLVQKLLNDRFISCFAALMFGVNPVNTACVAYISGRADIMVCLFMLVSLLFFISGCPGAAGGSRRKNAAFIVSACAYFLAMLSKEYAIAALPLMISVYCLVFCRKKTAGPGIYVPYAAAALLYLTLRTAAFSGISSRELELASLGAFPRIFTAIKTVFLDIRIIFIPYDLHFGRTTSVEYSLFGSTYAVLTVTGVILTAFILGKAYRAWTRERNDAGGGLFFGLSWFFGSMLPLLNIYPLQVFHADNWLYFSSIGIYITAGVFIRWVSGQLLKKDIIRKSIVAMIVLSMALVYGAATVKRNKDYSDPILFCLSSVKWRPNVKFYRLLGALYGQRGDYEKSAEYSRKAVEVNRTYPSPDVYGAYFDLGITYARLGRYQESADSFKKAMMSKNTVLREKARRQLQMLRKQRRLP